MRIAVIGDVHLGASYSLGRKDHKTGRNTRLKDYETTLEKTINKVIDDGCEVIVFTGDIFEHRHPNAVYQKIFSQMLCMALQNGIKYIFIVIGNHDQQRQSNATTISYLQELNLPNIVVFDEIGTHKYIKDGDVIANLLFLPYRDRKWYNVDTYGEAISEIDSRIKYELSTIDNDAPKILVGHMAMEGTFFADEYADLMSDNDLFLPVDMFNSIDVTIMGHVHTPFVISKDPYVAYVGSMEKRGAFEDHEKKYAIINTNTKEISYGTEPCRNIFDIKIDFSNAVQGDALHTKISEEIEEFNEKNSLEGAIVRVVLSIAADDATNCDASKIENEILEKYKANHCVPIKPQLFFSRQARDSNITEDSSDKEAFSRYCKNTIDDEDLLEEMLKTGLDIIKECGGS